MDHRTELNHWVDKWEKAQKENIFPEEKPFVPSAKTSGETFFGTTNQAPSDTVKSVDAKYWRDVYAQSTGEAPQVLSEEKLSISNPVHMSSVGPDAKLSSAAMGLTFTEEDMEQLAELKLKLHDLENQLNAFEERGENSAKFGSKINSVKKKISELSDSFNKEFTYGSGASPSHE